MDPQTAVSAALSVRQGTRKLSDFSPEDQAFIRSALRRLTSAQLGRLAAKPERRARGERMMPLRGLHDAS